MNHPVSTRPTRVLPGLLFLPLMAVDASAQLGHPLSPLYDASVAPSAGLVPGLQGAFRQQILVSASRFVALKGKTLVGIQLRRDPARTEALRGGRVAMEVRVGLAKNGASQASEVFADNWQGTASLVLQADVTIPNSPARPAPRPLWDANDTVHLGFTGGFKLGDQDVCIELIGRPVTGVEPWMWYLDFERGNGNGKITPFGRSCSSFHADGQSLHARSTRLQIGSTLEITLLGRPASNPLLLIGGAALRPGLDLAPLGAPGCMQHIQPIWNLPLTYRAPPMRFPFAIADFATRIPADPALLDTSTFLQAADLETSTSGKTNRGGLTTSNALELRLSKNAPTLGLSTVESHSVAPTSPMPQRGVVDVERGPVMRWVYRD
ncbi:MAG: hypothetical protein KDC87_14180 [Planctomycetes bacterium]|nr:hypothetical protein [Planctomycetota bacterium]MCB9871327.1 hypothetical protein [Planctomycetota bacterium]MCB9888582.1 hypothetical protein [Planctomycetota bacterium]